MSQTIALVDDDRNILTSIGMALGRMRDIKFKLISMEKVL